MTETDGENGPLPENGKTGRVAALGGRTRDRKGESEGERQRQT